jgi:hypothetical protein
MNFTFPRALKCLLTEESALKVGRRIDIDAKYLHNISLSMKLHLMRLYVDIYLKTTMF